MQDNLKAENLTYPFLAGVLDGDGFIRTYKNTGEYEITMHAIDMHFLNQLKIQFGGTIRKVLHKNALRYVLNAKNALDKNTLLTLTNGLNGHIRNTIRVNQFQKLCSALNIKFNEPKAINWNDGYVAGLFITDGSIYMNCRPSAASRKAKLLNNSLTAIELIDDKEKKIQRILKGVAPVIEIRIVNKFLVNIGDIGKVFNMGKTVFSKGNLRAPEGHYIFFIKKENEILQFYNYMNIYKTASVKHHRLDLIPTFYSLISKKAHLIDSNTEAVAKQWEVFVRSWYSIDS